MAVGLDLVLGQGDVALGVHDDGGADNSLMDFAVDQFLAPGAVGQGDCVVGVGEQREGQREVAAEAGQGFLGVGEMPITS